MSPPEWRMTLANDGTTEVRTLRHDDGTLSIRLSAGAVSIVAAVAVDSLASAMFTTADEHVHEPARA